MATSDLPPGIPARPRVLPSRHRRPRHLRDLSPVPGDLPVHQGYRHQWRPHPLGRCRELREAGDPRVRSGAAPHARVHGLRRDRRRAAADGACRAACTATAWHEGPADLVHVAVRLLGVSGECGVAPDARPVHVARQLGVAAVRRDPTGLDHRVAVGTPHRGLGDRLGGHRLQPPRHRGRSGRRGRRSARSREDRRCDGPATVHPASFCR